MHYTGLVTITPNEACPPKQRILQIGHGDDRIEQEAEEMRKRAIRHAIDCPGAMVIHLGYTSVAKFSRHDQSLGW